MPDKLTDTDGNDSASLPTKASAAAAVVKGEAGTRKPKRGIEGADAQGGEISQKIRKRRRPKAAELAPAEEVRLGEGAAQTGLVEDGGGCGGDGGDGGVGDCVGHALSDA